MRVRKPAFAAFCFSAAAKALNPIFSLQRAALRLGGSSVWRRRGDFFPLKLLFCFPFSPVLGAGTSEVRTARRPPTGWQRGLGLREENSNSSFLEILLTGFLPRRKRPRIPASDCSRANARSTWHAHAPRIQKSRSRGRRAKKARAALRSNTDEASNKKALKMRILLVLCLLQ